MVNWKRIYIKTLRQTKLNKLNTFFNKILNRSRINHSLPQTFKLLNALNMEFLVYINDIKIVHDRQKKSKQIRSFEMSNILKIKK